MTSDAREVFWGALRGAPEPLDDPYWARRVAAAVAVAVGATAASISIMAAQLRVPFGASDADAAHAESVQFTEGDGPCLQGIRTDSPVIADHDVLTAQWPGVARRWAEETPFRAARSEPLHIDGVVGSLNLYADRPDGASALDNDDVVTVAQLVCQALRVDLDVSTPTPDMHRRELVWLALGMLRERHGISAGEALSRLREMAVRDQSTIDDVSVAVTQDFLDSI